MISGHIKMKNLINEIGSEVIDLQIKALKKLKGSINQSFNDAVKAITNCKSKVILCGVGKSGKIASKIISATNEHPTESRYISVAQIPEQWPFIFHDDMYTIKRISISNTENLEDYIINSKNELTHIIVDDNPDLPKFLQDVNAKEQEYEYLKKIFDSKNEGFNHQMKIFEIDYEKFDFINLK